MATVACLGWGSLVWNAEQLPVRGPWFEDGPLVKVEYTRQSNNGRMTLVLEPSAKSVRSLWAVMDCDELDVARKALKQREKTSIDFIGTWVRGESKTLTCIAGIGEWAASCGVDSVIWTDLPSKFNDHDGQMPTCEQVVAYLSGLTGSTRELAEQYIRRTPKQIATRYRKEIEASLAWTHLE